MVGHAAVRPTHSAAAADRLGPCAAGGGGHDVVRELHVGVEHHVATTAADPERLAGVPAGLRPPPAHVDELKTLEVDFAPAGYG